MKFEEALVYLKAGKKIKATYWKDGYIYSEENRVWYQGHETYCIGNKDLFEEWELYEEKENKMINNEISLLWTQIRGLQSRCERLEQYFKPVANITPIG